MGRRGDPGRSTHSKADCGGELQWWRGAPLPSQPSRFSARVSHRAPGVPTQWWRCCSFPSPRLEQDIKKLKADLQASRQVEQELRSQISSLSSTERGIRSEMGQLRQENELLQNKYVHLVGLWQWAKQPLSLLFSGIGVQGSWWQKNLAEGFLKIKCLFSLVWDIQCITKSIKTFNVKTV